MNVLTWLNDNSGLVQLVILVAVLPLLRSYTRRRTEQGQNIALLGALTRGFEFALSALATMGTGPVTRATLTALAIEYAKRSQPEAFAALSPSPDQLRRVAQAQGEPVMRAAQATAAAVGAPLPLLASEGPGAAFAIPGTPTISSLTRALFPDEVKPHAV